MALFDFEKTTIKLPFAVTIMTLVLAGAGGIWRIESKMSDFESKLESLETKILYKTTIEFMKINNRIDLVEAKKFVMRFNFKRRKKAFENNGDSFISGHIACNTETNKRKDKNERRPQFCMVLPPHPELKRLKLPNIKNLKA